MIQKFSDPNLQSLAAHLPARVIECKAPSTVDRYSRAFTEFKKWTARYVELTAFPASSSTVSLYLEYLIQNNSPYSRLESAFYGINWAHSLYGLDSPCVSGLVKSVLESAKRKLAKPTTKKDPITLEMLTKLCGKYATDKSNLSDLRVAAICVTAFHAFLRFSELAGLRCCDVKFVNSDSHGSFVELYILKSKTDVYHDGNKVVMAKTNDVSCPFNILCRYVNKGNISLYSTGPFFRSLSFCKTTQLYKLRLTGISYSRTREIVLAAFSSLGYSTKLLGLHSLRSGGATAAANAGINDRLFKRHGRWKSETAKDGYVKDNLHSLLSVSKCLHV